MSYKPVDPLTDLPRQPDKLRRPIARKISAGDAMELWIIGIIAGLLVVMLVYGYIRPNSTTASAPPSQSSRTTTGAAPAPSPKANPLAATPSPAPSTSAPDNR